MGTIAHIQGESRDLLLTDSPLAHWLHEPTKTFWMTSSSAIIL